MLKKIQGYHFFLFIVSLIPALSSYLTLSDIFRQSGEWLMINGLISAVCFLITMGTFITALSKKKLDLLALFCAILCTALGWLYLYFDNPDVRADLIKSAYLTDNINYKSWKIHYDFTNVEIRDQILKDEVFIGKMMKKIAVDSSYDWQQVAKGIYQNEYKEYGLMLLLALRYQGKSDKQILALPYSEELLLAVFFNELRPTDAGNDLNLPSWAGKMLVKKPSALFKQGAVNQGLWQDLVKKRLSQIEKMGAFSCEMFLYLLTKIPTKIDAEEFAKLMNHWANLKPTYKTEILGLTEKRNRIYAIGQKIAKNDTLFIDLESYKSTSSFSVLAPLIISAGFVPALANASPLGDEKAVVFDVKLAVDLIKSERVPIYEEVEKTRTKPRAGRHSAPATETYYEKRYKGAEQENTYSYFYVIKFKMKDSQSFTDSILTFEHLPHQYFDKQKEDYTIDYAQRARDECWLYALPQKLY